MKGEQLFRIHTGRVDVRCSICWKKIPVGEERLTANLGSGLYPKHFHLSCFICKYEDEIKYLYEQISNPSSRGHKKK
jgi:hypothetical protein